LEWAVFLYFFIHSRPDRWFLNPLQRLFCPYPERISGCFLLDGQYSVLGNAAEIASPIPVSPSAQMIRISFTPRLDNVNFAALPDMQKRMLI